MSTTPRIRKPLAFHAGVGDDAAPELADPTGIIGSLSEVVFQTDADGRWTFLNPAWSELTGFSIVDTLGTSFLA